MAESKIDIVVSMMDKLTAPMQQATAGVDKITKQVEAMDKAMKTTQSTMGSTGNAFSNHAATSKRLAKDLEGTGKSIMAVGSQMKWLTGTLIAAASAGMKLHSDFANGMAKVSTLVETSVVSIQKLSDGIRAISDETGTSVTDLAEAEYQALSAGVDAAKVTDFLRVSTMAAKAGFTDSATAIDGVTSVLNAYGMEADKAMNIFDQMLMTQNFGKTTLGEMAGALGNVIPVASTLNVSTQELFASIAVLTKNGIQTSAAITGLKGAYSNILKPSTQASKLAEQLGLDFSAAHLKSVGWAKMLDEIREKTGGSADQMATLFGSVEGLNAVLALTGKGHADFVKGLDIMNNSAGATEQAFYKLLTPAEQNKIAMNQLKNATMDLAQGLTPLLKGTAQLVGAFAKWLKDLSPAQKTAVENVAKMIVAVGILTPVVGSALAMFGRTYGTLIDFAVAVQKNHGVMGALASKFSGTINVARALRSEFSVMGTVIGNALRAVPGGVANAFSRMSGLMTSMGRLIMHPTMAFNLLRQASMMAFRGIMLAMRVALLSPMGIAITVLVGLAYLIWKNWDTVKTRLSSTFNIISTNFTAFVERMKERFGGLFSKVQQVASKLVNFVKLVWNMITGSTVASGSTIRAIIGNITSFIGAAFVTGFNLAVTAVETAVNIITTVIGGVITVIGGVITVLTGIITGDWAMVWQGAVEIFSGIFGAVTGICDNVLQGVKGAINAVIGGINSISVTVPEWVPGVGGQSYTPNIPYLAHGTDNFPGGLAVIHDAGPEIVDLPQGTRVIPHDKSMRAEYNRGRQDGVRTAINAPLAESMSGKSITVNIPKIADSIVIREDADIISLARAIAEQLERRAGNQMVGAV